MATQLNVQEKSNPIFQQKANLDHHFHIIVNSTSCRLAQPQMLVGPLNLPVHQVRAIVMIVMKLNLANAVMLVYFFIRLGNDNRV